MADTNLNPANYSLDAALTDLADLLKPAPLNETIEEYVYYLLLLWASFQVYQLEPYVEDEGGEGGGGAKIIPLNNGRIIADYGYYLSSSPGDDYGNYCTGKLIDAAKEMIAIVAKRGAIKVAFLGHPIAQRAAWIECLERGIEVTNFEASEVDYMTRQRVQKLREYMKTHTKSNLAPEEDTSRPT